MINLDFVGVGFSKCATSWIAKILEEHPDVFLPKTKELHFFNNRQGNYDKNLSNLQKYFVDSNESQILGEFTPRYIISHKAITRIKCHFPEIKIIVSLRDPIDRMISQYKYFIFDKKKENDFNFLSAIESFYYNDYIEKSLYSKHLEHLFKVFQREQILVLLYNEIKDNPKGTVKKIYNFLGVDSKFIPQSLSKKVNRTKSTSLEEVSFFYNTINKYLSNLRYATNFQNKKDQRIFKLMKHYNFFKKILTFIDHNPNLVFFLEKKLLSITHPIEINQKDIQYFYQKYFEKDISLVESILNIHLNEWKNYK